MALDDLDAQFERWRRGNILGSELIAAITMTPVGREREAAMGDSANKTEARFANIVKVLSSSPGVTHSKPGSRLFGSSSLKVQDKIFAMISSSGEFVVKLPMARVDELVIAGTGERFDAKRGRPMKEWLEVRSDSPDEWLQLAREALEFVGT